MSEALLEKIRQCDLLPSPPILAMQVLELVRSDAPITEIAAVISQDPALAAKLLKTANSSFYKRSHTVGTIPQAIKILGTQAVRILVLGFAFVGRLQAHKTTAFDYSRFWRRSLYAAVATRSLAQRLKMIQKDECFLAALLADLGMLALDQVHPAYGELCCASRTHAELAEIESQVLTLTHADISGIFARQWKLPAILAIPMGAHHCPEKATDAFGKKMSEMVMIGGLCGDVFVQANAPEALLEARKACGEFLGISEKECDLLLTEVATAAIETSSLFEVKLGPTIDFLEIEVRAEQLAANLAINKSRAAA